MEVKTYQEALQWIHTRTNLGMKPGLKRMEWLMEKLRHPERYVKVIHVGGTNGKGSTIAYLRQILQEAEYKVGTFTSPYFEKFNERISINGTPISDDDLVKLTNVIKPLCEELDESELGGPTEFEVITAMAIYYFARINPVDVALFEVGLGGRLDSTNVLYPILTIITNIGKDHTNFLGNTYEEIAFEKAGIIKSGVTLITGATQPEALKVLEDKAKEKRASVYLKDREFRITEHERLPDGERFSVETIFQTLNGLRISMKGRHQTENAALAVMAAIYLNKLIAFYIEEEHIRNGLAKAAWPGRFEIVSEYPFVLIDGAHNEEGAAALVDELKARYSGKKMKVVFAALEDKNWAGMISRFDEIADEIIFTEFDFPRAAKAEKLAQHSRAKNKKVVPDWKEAVKEATDGMGAEEMLVVTGSLYFIPEVKKWLRGQ